VRIVDLCLEERVDALMLAGDLYDGDQTSMKTARFLAEQIGRLHQVGIRVFVVRGNHDALSRITKELIFPDSVKVFSGRADAVTIDRPTGNFPVVIHGLSFTQPHAPESLITKYKPVVVGAVNIGIMHTSLGGGAGHDPYAPCSVADLQATGFRYWALGHVHKRSVVEGACAIVMPGMPQGRDISESGVKSVTLVTVRDDLSILIEERTTSIAEFERVSVNASGLDDWRDLIAAVTRALHQTREAAVSEHVVARLRVTGNTPLSWRIRRDLDLLKAEADNRGALIGACWIEKLEVATNSPDESAISSADPLVELRRLIEEEVLQSETFQAEILTVSEELRAQLPQECRDSLGADDKGFKAEIALLAREGADDILAKLHASEEGA
jgi:DNA repair protein SbcD/Mre11